MDAQDGEIFINHLAQYIRKHEKHLANSLNLPNRRPLTAPGPASSQANTSSASSNPFASLHAYLGLGSSNITPAKLFLTPNQLYYLLARFEELNVDVGPCNIRLENIHARPISTNYVSFLTETPRPKGRRSFDQESIQSVSSIRSTVSSVWSNIGASFTGGVDAKRERHQAALREDIRYLYSAFTKIPTLKLAVDHRIRKIAGYDEFPFDMAVPVFVFKNLSHFEVMDCDYRTFYGWDRLAEQLRTLTVKRAGLEDVSNLLTDIVLDDMEQRRCRSSKNTATPIAYPSASPRLKQAELAHSPTFTSGESPKDSNASRSNVSPGTSPINQHFARPRIATSSPSKASAGRRASYHSHRMQRGPSNSSNGSSPVATPRGSSSNLLNFGQLPTTKWRFLRHLNLPENGLTSISVESLKPVLSTLQSLDLSSNLFTEVPDALSSIVSLRALNLSHNMIDSVRSLAKTPLPAIAVLNLRANRIASIAGIERLVSLERIDLRDNRIRDPTELARLTGMPEFHEVYVTHNPFTKTHSNYRVQIFNLFRAVPGYDSDVVIDGSGPGYNERKQLHSRRCEIPQPSLGMPDVSEELTLVNVLAETDTDARPQLKEEASIPVPDQSATDAQPTRRKKGPKRRVVEISQAEDASSTTLSPSLERHSLASGEPQKPTTSKPDDDKPLPELPRETKPAASLVEHPAEEQALPLSAAHEHIDKNDTYRRRIESLKKDYGSDWLSALGDADAAVNARRVQKEGSVHSGEGIASPAFTAISAGASMSTSRRLG